MLVPDFYVEHWIVFHILQGRILCVFFSYAIVADIPHVQKGGVNHREKHLAR